MQKYATRGHDDIVRKVPRPTPVLQVRDPLLWHRRPTKIRRACEPIRVRLASSPTFVGVDGDGRVHNGRMKGRPTGSRDTRSVVPAEDRALFLDAMAGV